MSVHVTELVFRQSFQQRQIILITIILRQSIISCAVTHFDKKSDKVSSHN